jgi:PAS domain S-box-containing protein
MHKTEPTNDELKKRIAILERDIQEERLLRQNSDSTHDMHKMLWDKPLVGIYIIQKGKFCSLNQICMHHIGYELQDLIGKQVDILIHPEDRDDAKRNARAMLRGERFSPYEFRIVTKDKQIRWVIETVTPTLFKGQPAILGSSVDITERKISEEKLKESENFYRTLFETTGAATAIINADSTLSLVNSEFERLTGYRREDWEGKRKWTELVHKDDLPKMLKYHKFRRTNPKAAPRNYEFRLVDSQGKIRNIYITIDMIPGTNKSISSNTDITDWKEAGKRLEESENLYRAIFETTVTAIMIIEEDMTLSLINSGFEKLTGYSKEEWEGKRKWTEAIAEEDLGWMKEYHVLRRKDPDLAPRSYEHHLIDSQGRIRNILSTVDIIPGTKKSVSSFTDITEMREAEKELKMKSQKLAELNTALTVLLNKRVEDVAEIEQRILTNVKELVIPYVEIIKKSHMDPACLTYINLLESNLKEIVSPFAHRLSSNYLNLTPREIQIANFIKDGKTSKEIADILNVSKSAIDVHRYRLRKKVGLNSKKTNLRNHLTTM